MPHGESLASQETAQITVRHPAKIAQCAALSMIFIGPSSHA